MITIRQCANQFSVSDEVVGGHNNAKREFMCSGILRREDGCLRRTLASANDRF